MTAASLLAQSSVATAFSNLDSARCRNASLETRKEGWTEVWGVHEEEAKEEDMAQWQNDEDAMVSR